MKSAYLERYRQIVGILSRHGFGWLLVEFQRRNLLPAARRGAETADPARQAVEMRLAFEELGTTFVKLGQVLSTRPDVLPPVYLAELIRLQDAVPPVPYEAVAAILGAELGRPVEECFAFVHREPLAAASIGQVHVARLRRGEEVVVKVQRPEVAATVERDLEILLDLARAAAEYSRFGEAHDVLGLAEEFGAVLRAELDYIREGKNADRFRAAFAGEPELHIPRIHWDLSTARVLVQERLQGIPMRDVAALDAAGIDRKKLAATSVRLMLEQIFTHGFFHADPHPGNLFVLPDGRIGLIDFGMMGQLGEPLKETLTRLFLALARSDSERLMDELLAIGASSGEIRPAALQRDLERMLALRAGDASQEVGSTEMIEEVIGVARRHGLRLPRDLTMLAKVLVISEGIGLRLDPEFDFPGFARPYLERFSLEQRSPERVRRKLAAGLLDTAELGLGLPRRLSRLLLQVERGEMGARVQLRDLDRLLNALGAMVNRLVVGILVGALIIGLNLFMLMITMAGLLEPSGAAYFGLLFLIVTPVLGFLVILVAARPARR